LEREKIPLENEGIDVILLIDVLHIIRIGKPYLDEANRILKRGGFIAVYPMYIEEKDVEELAASRNLKVRRQEISKSLSHL